MFCSFSAWACSPQYEDEVIVVPPANAKGEFRYIYPKTDEEKLAEEFNTKDVALVNLYIDYHRSSYPFDAHTELEVAYGWGSAKKKYIKYIRPETSCGKPEKYKENRWYYAIFSNPNDEHPYKYVKYHVGTQLIQSRGEPNYVHTSYGLHKKP